MYCASDCVVGMPGTLQTLHTNNGYEESGNYLLLKDIKADCNNDTLLIKATPQGPICHTGADTCWNEKNTNNNFLQELEQIIIYRKNNPADTSYTNLQKA